MDRLGLLTTASDLFGTRVAGADGGKETRSCATGAVLRDGVGEVTARDEEVFGRAEGAGVTTRDDVLPDVVGSSRFTVAVGTLERTLDRGDGAVSPRIVASGVFTIRVVRCTADVSPVGPLPPIVARERPDVLATDSLAYEGSTRTLRSCAARAPLATEVCDARELRTLTVSNRVRPSVFSREAIRAEAARGLVPPSVAGPRITLCGK